MIQILNDFIQDLFIYNNIPARIISIPNADWSWTDLILYQDIMGADKYDVVNNQIASCEDATIYHFAGPLRLNYTCIKLPDGEGYLIIGPVLFEQLDSSWFEDIVRSLQLPEKLREPLKNYYSNVSLFPHREIFENLIALTGDYLFGQDGYRTVYKDAGYVTEGIQLNEDSFQTSEKPFLNLPFIESLYNQENALLLSVMAGDENRALICLSHAQDKLISHIASANLREGQNYNISLNTLLRKAAEHTGVHPIHIDKCFHENILQIEQLVSTEQCKAFARKMVQEYCRLVNAYNMEGHSRSVRKVIAYVNANLSTDLSLKSLAEQLNVNASYLSSLFKKEMGIVLMEYINRCRVRYAKQLMLCTDLPIKTIASQCGIPDLSYFSHLFKRIAGVTPKIYRAQRDPKIFYTANSDV